jgi:hypothetical protein
MRVGGMATFGRNSCPSLTVNITIFQNPFMTIDEEDEKNVECFRFLIRKIIIDSLKESEEKFGIRPTSLGVMGIIPMLANFFVSCFPNEKKKEVWEKLKNSIEVKLDL